MNAVIALEQRFDRTPDGRIWTTSAFSDRFWERYLAVFDGVSVLARIREVPSPPSGASPVGGEAIRFLALPYYQGPLQYLLKVWSIRAALRSMLGASDALILRAPGRVATSVMASTVRSRRPYGMEIVGDPWDVFAPGAVAHPLRPFFRWWFTRQLRREAAGAIAVAYVTSGTLQARYPAAGSAFVTHYSSIDLSTDAFTTQPRMWSRPATSLRLVMVGSLEQLYKAPDVLIDAVGQCTASGLDLRLTIVGDGRHRPELEARARRLGLDDRVTFAGHLPFGDAVRERLDEADLFVLVSRTEGLPRAMIEAMARGLPCIGSAIGGIPELLPPEDLVPAGDASALAKKITELVRDAARMERMSARNLERARDYREDVLRERRLRFYGAVRQRTEAWIATGRGQ